MSDSERRKCLLYSGDIFFNIVFEVPTRKSKEKALQAAGKQTYHAKMLNFISM